MKKHLLLGLCATFFLMIPGAFSQALRLPGSGNVPSSAGIRIGVTDIIIN